MFCNQNTFIKYGRRSGKQRYRCSVCSKFLPVPNKPDSRNSYSKEVIRIPPTIIFYFLYIFRRPAAMIML
ncbi:transposase-like zinc-binding domain-containing protein [Neisseria lisongii]|uniref:IS1/IS1595 family N-terminal zinc-binding domain-containing protein n=1 Tax=Neisseria lisongii TaxID=2912188 RepID=UPI003D3ED376